MKSVAHNSHGQRASQRLAEVCLRCLQISSASPHPTHFRHGLVYAQVRGCYSRAALTTPVNFYSLPRSIQFA